MVPNETAEEVLARLEGSHSTGRAFRSEAVKELSQIRGYDWSGVYRLEGSTLVIDEFVGEPTDHTRIGVGVGVCGTAIQEDRNQVIEDVRKLDNYLACSLSTRSEIVVLIRWGNRILGQIDIDGHEVGAFDRSDEKFLEAVAELIADRWDGAS